MSEKYNYHTPDQNAVSVRYTDPLANAEYLAREYTPEELDKLKLHWETVRTIASKKLEQADKQLRYLAYAETKQKLQNLKKAEN